MEKVEIEIKEEKEINEDFFEESGKEDSKRRFKYVVLVSNLVHPETKERLVDIDSLIAKLRGFEDYSCCCYIIHDKDYKAKFIDDEELKNIADSNRKVYSKFKNGKLKFWVYDLDDKGEKIPRDSHIHLFIEFKKPIYLSKISKLLEFNEEYFTIPSRNKKLQMNFKNNMLSYLIHRTSGAIKDDKYQYDIDEVVSYEMDYESLLEEIEKETWQLAFKKAGIDVSQFYISTDKEDKILYLDIIRTGIRYFGWSKEYILKTFQEINYHRVIKDYDIYYSEYLERKKGIFDIKNENGIYIPYKSMIYISVDRNIVERAGIGKTALAEFCKNYAIRNYNGVFKDSFNVAGEKVAFQKYKMEDILLFNDVRASTIYSAFKDYNEFLKYGDSNMHTPLTVDVKYGSVKLLSKLAIFESILPFDSFVMKIFGKADRTYEDYNQIKRRFGLIIEITNKGLKIFRNNNNLNASKGELFSLEEYTFDYEKYLSLIIEYNKLYSSINIKDIDADKNMLINKIKKVETELDFLFKKFFDDFNEMYQKNLVYTPILTDDLTLKKEVESLSYEEERIKKLRDNLDAIEKINNDILTFKVSKKDIDKKIQDKEEMVKMNILLAGDIPEYKYNALYLHHSIYALISDGKRKKDNFYNLIISKMPDGSLQFLHPRQLYSFYVSKCDDYGFISLSYQEFNNQLDEYLGIEYDFRDKYIFYGIVCDDSNDEYLSIKDKLLDLLK